MREMDGLGHVFASFVTWLSLRTWSILSFSLFCKSSLSASSMVDPPCCLFGRKALTELCSSGGDGRGGASRFRTFRGQERFGRSRHTHPRAS